MHGCARLSPLRIHYYILFMHNMYYSAGQAPTLTVQYNCSSGAVHYICFLPTTTNAVHWIAEPFVALSRVILFSTTTAPFMTIDRAIAIHRVCQDPFISMITIQPSVLQSLTIVCEDFTTKENATWEHIPGDVSSGCALCPKSCM